MILGMVGLAAGWERSVDVRKTTKRFFEQLMRVAMENAHSATGDMLQ